MAKKTTKKEKGNTKTKKSEKNSEKKVVREENGNITFNITVASNEVEQARKKVIDNLISQVEVPGFRKGKAPRSKAESQLNKEKVKEETLKQVLPDKYNEAVKEAGITPIINPQVHVEVFDEGTDLKVKAVTAEAPEVKLGDYKKAIKDVTAKSKIIKPGEEASSAQEQDKKPQMNEVIEAAMKVTDVKIPQVLIDQEVTRLLSQLIDELKSIGMSLEQYLNSRGLDGEKIREQYREKAKNDLKMEFMLRKIGDEEGIQVEEKDITEALAQVKDEKQRENIMQNPYLVANVVRQQKTLNHLSNL